MATFAVATVNAQTAPVKQPVKTVKTILVKHPKKKHHKRHHTKKVIQKM